MFSGHYDDWIESRMRGINKYVRPGYFKSKTMLELGGGHAHNGNKFHALGAIVTSSDARQEHLTTANRIYPHITTRQIDGDNMDTLGKYDVILHWGLLYHLNEIEKHLEKVAAACDVLLLETEVSDSNDPTFAIQVNEGGYDQAFNSRGIRPSPSYVETVLARNGFNFKMICDPCLNAGFHNYDWTIRNTNTWRNGLRRYWICWKDGVECPLI
jgi:hypothetical protein